MLLVPPLEQPRSPLLPLGVCTTTLKLPGPGIIEEVTLTVSCEWLTTVVARFAPLNITTDAETKLLPVAVRTKLGGKSAKANVVGSIESSTGTGRALPHRGFRFLHPGRSNTASNEQKTTIREERDMKECNLSASRGN